MPLTVINQAQQLAGTLTSGTVAVPIGGATIQIGSLMNTPDITAPGNSVTLGILWSFDGLTFPAQPVAGITWQSGPLAVYQGTQTPSPPSFQCAIPLNVLAYQVQIQIPQPLNIGATMTIVNLQGLPLPISIEVQAL